MQWKDTGCFVDFLREESQLNLMCIKNILFNIDFECSLS